MTEDMFYQAVGVICGILDTNGMKLSVGEHVYPVWARQAVFCKHEPGVEQSFIAYPKEFAGRLGFWLRSVKTQAPETLTFKLKGCWEKKEGHPHFKIYRNEVCKFGNYTILHLDWDNSPSPNGKYWEIEAQLQKDLFHVVSAIGPFKPPAKAMKQKKSAKPVGGGNPQPQEMMKAAILDKKAIAAPKKAAEAKVPKKPAKATDKKNKALKLIALVEEQPAKKRPFLGRHLSARS